MRNVTLDVDTAQFVDNCIGTDCLHGGSTSEAGKYGGVFHFPVRSLDIILTDSTFSRNSATVRLRSQRILVS